MPHPVKVLLAKIGLDPHDKGVKLVARGLRDIGGMDVIYTGLYRSIEEIPDLARQHQVNVVGISVHTGMQMSIFPQLRSGLDRQGLKDTVLIGGGVVPESDIKTLKASGTAAEFFGPGASIEAIISWISGICESGE